MLRSAQKALKFSVSFLYGVIRITSPKCFKSRQKYSGRAEKSKLLGHAELITERSRKHLIWRLNNINYAPSSDPIKLKGRPLNETQRKIFIFYLCYLDL